MSSSSLASLAAGVDEVRALRGHFVVKRGAIPSGIEADAAKAHGRACVVLLSSHWERYLYAVNEEAVDWLNRMECEIANLPLELLLQHSQAAIDEIARVDWLRREQKLRAFIARDGALWSDSGRTGRLEHAQLLTWMKSPKPQEITRFYRQYGIPNIFEAVTRKKATRSVLYLNLSELVEKRNLIAHGDATTEALPVDVTRYLNSVQKFAQSADSVFSRSLAKMAKASDRPW